MSREIRITVDDDEVFERMKRRKGELDLSWEEVLHRGLRVGPEDRPGGRGGERGPSGPRGPQDSDWDPAGGDRTRRRGRDAREERDQWDQFGESLERQIQNRVYDTLQSSFGAAGIDVPDRPGMDEEMEDLASAEDASLVFEFLPDERAYEVPLRVDVQTGPDGMAVEVVAVREGKNVRDTNRFDTDARKRVNTNLATGSTATLRFADGAETYPVKPMLSWGRGSEGRPRVDAVEIVEVVLDGQQ